MKACSHERLSKPRRHFGRGLARLGRGELMVMDMRRKRAFGGPMRAFVRPPTRAWPRRSNFERSVLTVVQILNNRRAPGPLSEEGRPAHLLPSSEPCAWLAMAGVHVSHWVFCC